MDRPAWAWEDAHTEEEREAERRRIEVIRERRERERPRLFRRPAAPDAATQGPRRDPCREGADPALADRSAATGGRGDAGDQDDSKYVLKDEGVNLGT